MSSEKIDLFKKYAKDLVQNTPKKWLRDTMNLLLVSTGARNAYYNDFDMQYDGDFSIQAMPKKYQTVFLNLCNFMELSILFVRNNQWIVYNPRIKMPKASSDYEIGKLLDFPCKTDALQATNKIAVDLEITTNLGKTFITNYYCKKGEIQKAKQWFYKMKGSVLSLEKLGIFSSIEAILTITMLDKDDITPLKSTKYTF